MVNVRIIVVKFWRLNKFGHRTEKGQREKIYGVDMCKQLCSKFWFRAASKIKKSRDCFIHWENVIGKKNYCLFSPGNHGARSHRSAAITKTHPHIRSRINPNQQLPWRRVRLAEWYMRLWRRRWTSCEHDLNEWKRLGLSTAYFINICENDRQGFFYSCGTDHIEGDMWQYLPVN